MSARSLRRLAVAGTLLLGCADTGLDENEAGSPPLPAPSPAESPLALEDSVADTDVADPTPAEWTAGIVESEHAVAGAALLTDVRTSANEGFDRVVLEFENDRIPSYHIEYVDRPIVQCGSGEAVPVDGERWLAVRLETANAHTEEGQPTVLERSSRPDLPILRQLTLTCDFEAQVEWVLGVASPNRYRVMELVEPARLVVDVRH